MWSGGVALVLVLGAAHVAARAAGARAVADLSKAVPIAPFALVSLATLRYLWPHLGRERAPVAVYVSVIAVMGWRAAVRALAASPPPASGGLALAGALLFMLSDGLLATDRFARRLRAAEAAVMTTYYAAQTLIALSVRG